jgi:hypothetical protein
LRASILREGADPIMLSLQLGRFADAWLAKQCQCSVSLQIGKRPQHVRIEMIVDGIAQEASVREVEHAGLRDPETLPVISNVTIARRTGCDRRWRKHGVPGLQLGVLHLLR